MLTPPPTTDELAALEQDTGLVFGGWLYDGRCVIPVLLKLEHVERRRAIVVALSASTPGGT